MSALLVILAVGLAQPEPAAVGYCASRVASLPDGDRDEAKERCEATVSEFMHARDRVAALKRLALLEAWLRLREAPIALPTVSECKHAVEERDAELQREASERLARGRQELHRQRTTEPEHRREPDLMNPF